MKSKTRIATVVSGLLSATAPAAWAHPGHGLAGGFTAGFAHPLTGVDHILAMLAVGLVAVQMGRRAMWMLPLAFVTALLGGAIAVHGGSLPMVEQAIAVSVLVLGLLVAAGSRIALPVATGLVALFGAFHGYAHGTELATQATTCMGFILASVGLIAVGMGLGLLFRRRKGVWKLAGAAITLAGIAMLCL